MTQTKITGLSRLNVQALDEVFRSRIESGGITLGKTFAMFDMDAPAALELVTNAVNHLPGKRHPKASLWAIQRRLSALIDPAAPEPEEEVSLEETAEPVGPIRRIGKIDPAALFLVDLAPHNMFEERRSSTGMVSGFECKLCTELVPKAQHESHHAAHRRDKSQYATEQIRARKEHTEMATEKKATPSEQGFPAVYLNEAGTKFLPGGDAQAKSDGVKTILHYEHGYTDIDLSGRKAELTLQQAKELMSIRGWNPWVIKALKNHETKIARARAKSEAKATKVKDEVAAKRQAKVNELVDSVVPNDVTPDPKPERKPRAGGRRKVGS